jgi:hypothetical protein
LDSARPTSPATSDSLGDSGLAARGGVNAGHQGVRGSQRAGQVKPPELGGGRGSQGPGGGLVPRVGARRHRPGQSEPAQREERPGADPRVHVNGLRVPADRLGYPAGGQGEVAGYPLR